MEMTKEQALQWLKEVKQNKKNTLERLTKIGIDEYEKERESSQPI